MTSRRKLEEEIARTKDPIVRKQIQELIDKRERRRDKSIKDAKEIGASLSREIDEAASPVISQVGAGLFISAVIGFIVLFLLWILGAL